MGSRNKYGRGCRDFRGGQRRQDATMRDRYGRAPVVQLAPPAGIEERGVYARVAQEPGMESRRSAATRNDTARVKLSRSGVERSERAVGAVTWGNLITGNPAEQRSAPTNRLVGGKDDRGTELAGRLNQTRTNSKTGEGQTGGQAVDAGPPHRRELVTRGLPPHAEGRGTWR